MKSHHGNTILHIAAEYKTHKSIIKTITSKCKPLLHEQNFNGDSPLHIAVRRKSLIRNVRLLIRDQTESNTLLRIVNQKGDTALHDAVRSNNLKAVELLIKADQELASIYNNEGESPLFVAVDKTFYNIARHILKAAPTCSFAGRKGMNVLHAAVIRSKPSKFYSIAHPICLFVLSVSPIGFVFFAAIWLVGAVMLIAFLCLLFLRRFKFSWIGSGFVREVYKRYPSAVSEADQFGWIPLHYAAYIGNWRLIELFLKLDTSESLLSMKENEGMSAIHIAAKGNQISLLRELLKKYPYVKDYVDNKGRTALHTASEEGKVKVMKFLTRKRTCYSLINEGDINGNTPLHLAALQEHTAICKLIISNSRINLRAINNDGLTAVDIIKTKDILDLKRQKKYVASLEDFVTREGVSNGIVDTGEASEKPKHAQKEYKELANVNLIIVTLVATVTFTAALTVPGGYNTDATKAKAGTAVLAKKTAFRAFVIADSLAFGFSAALLTLRFWKAIASKDEQARTVLKWSLICRNYAVLAMFVAFVSGQYVVLSNSSALAASALAVACAAFLAPGVAILWDNPIFALRFTEIFPVFDVPIRN